MLDANQKKASTCSPMKYASYVYGVSCMLNKCTSFMLLFGCLLTAYRSSHTLMNHNIGVSLHIMCRSCGGHSAFRLLWTEHWHCGNRCSLCTMWCTNDSCLRNIRKWLQFGASRNSMGRYCSPLQVTFGSGHYRVISHNYLVCFRRGRFRQDSS